MQTKSCKNCASIEFKDGKCSYCGTEYGLTGDKILDAKLLALKRKRIIEEDGWHIKRVYEKTENGSYPVNEWRFINEDNVYITYAPIFEEAIQDFWYYYVGIKYEPVIEQIII